MRSLALLLLFVSSIFGCRQTSDAETRTTSDAASEASPQEGGEGDVAAPPQSPRVPFAFDIQPLAGALPVRFGMPRSEVRHLLGTPEASRALWDGSGTTDYWNQSRINVGYDKEGTVKHIGFSPGGSELTLRGSRLWSLSEQPDPNTQLLRLDPKPVESVGILIYPKLGVSTSGYHDGDKEQYSLTVSRAGTWDDVLKEAGQPEPDK